VVQNDVSNQHSPFTIVAAISSQFATPPYPREVVIQPSESGLPKVSAVVNQIRSVDRKRLIERIGRLDALSLQRVDQALLISLGLVSL
jgi:mRNA interferase MazF